VAVVTWLPLAAIGAVVAWLVWAVLPMSWWRAGNVRARIRWRRRHGTWCLHPDWSPWYRHEFKIRRSWYRWCTGCGIYDYRREHEVPRYRRQEVGE
jgi:hypothetical protein